MKKSSLTLLVSVLALAGATAATAQTAPATPTPPTFGAPVPGQCVLDEQAALTTSNMGKAAIDRLGQLKSNVDAELQPEATALETEYKSLQAEQKASQATPATAQAFDKKAAAWSDRRDALQQKMQQRQQEMQVTQQQVFSAIGQKMIPAVNAIVTQKQCATVIASDSLLHYDAPAATGGEPVSIVYANPAMNITTDVVAKMNASGETLPPFERANLSRGAAAAPAARAPAAKPASK
jgi:Skp family chaperone for outer membrane proteins